MPSPDSPSSASAGGFVHLHVHSQYSLLDGALRVKDLASRAKALGMGAVALTDHGNMFGILQHHLACKDQGITPIFGCEVNVVREGRTTGPTEDVPVDHLVLLAASPEGYRNLVRVVSAGHLEPMSSRAPSIRLETVAQNRQGLIGLTGCLGGVVAQQVLEQGEGAGRTSLERVRDAFEEGSLYVELQDHGLPEQPIVSGILAKAARELGLPLVATNDVHFSHRDDGPSQLYLSCIAANRAFSDANAAHHGSYEMFLKGPDEMVHLFRDYPDAVKNTLAIAERCSGFKLKLGEPMLPSFKVPEGFDTDSYFRHVAKEGLERRFVEANELGLELDRKTYFDRLEVELDVICKMKFPGYFLIVWDFIRYAKEHGIPVGPGRGSGAGSIVAYAMRITDLDPLPYNLLFERFLNPERVSMPDFDVDFCMDRRDEVISYVAEKYGKRSVGQIATFHELKSRSVLKDVARTMGIPPNEAQRIASLVPQKGPGVMYTIPEALEIEPKLKAMVNTDGQIAELVKQAMKLEGLTRHAGMHAAGVVISEGPLDDHVPCFKNNEQIVTQYHKDDVEKAGLVKFDFLGLKTLTVIDIAERLVNARPDVAGRGTKFEVNKVPLTDKETYALLQSGETTGVFQLESSGMQQLFKDLRPDAFEDIVAAVALYRPGPLGTGMVKDFVDCKHGRKPIQKMHALVDDTLAATYGVIVYQEQVMQIAQKLAGYTLGGADLLRRAMGKKKPEEMAKQKAVFVEGSVSNGVSTEDAERIFGLLEFFAGYGFNKCVIGDTRVFDAESGRPMTVREMHDTRARPMVHALGDDGKLRPRRVTDVVSNGVKRVYELTTALGKRIVATDNHPFRTLDGWKNLGELSSGDAIATPRRMRVGGGQRWPDHEVVALGGLLSEGNTCHPSCLYFYGNDPVIVGDFAQAAASFPDSVARIDTRANGRLEVCVSTGRDARFAPGQVPWNSRQAAVAVDVAPRRSGMFVWAGGLGLLGKKATEKRVPLEAFALPEEQIALLIGRMWAGDGFIANATQAVPFYATSSLQLARDVQELLLRVGMVGKVATKQFRYRGTLRPGHTVHIVGDGAAERFLEVIAPHCVGRGKAIELLRAHLARTARGKTSKDTVPAGVRAWVDADRRAQGLKWDDLEEQSGYSMKEFCGQGSAKKLGFRRATVEAIGKTLRSDRILAAACSDIFWDRVVSIREAGREETFDLTVDEDHNFIADGIVVHNSHSAAYALLTYQTAYLKAHYPVEFLCALMTADRDKIEKVVRIIAEGRAWGVETLPPEINQSKIDFTVVYTEPGSGPESRRTKARRGGRRRDPYDPKIRFGLGAIRGVGEGALEAILESRNEGVFKDLFDLVERVDPRKVNKGVLEALVASGAFDATLAERAVTRSQAFAAIDSALERGRSASKDREVGQTNLFGLFAAAEPAKATSVEYPKAAPWDLRDTLTREKEALGFYVSGHPLDRYGVELSRFDVTPTPALMSMDPWSKVRVCGMVEGWRVRIFKGGGGKVAFFTLEDTTGRIEVKVRERQIDAYETVLTSGEPVLVSGKLSFPFVEEGEEEAAGPREPTLLLDEVVLLTDTLRAEARTVLFKLSAARHGPASMERLRTILEGSPGGCAVILNIDLEGGAEATLTVPSLKVEPTDALFGEVEKLLGGRVIELR